RAGIGCAGAGSDAIGGAPAAHQSRWVSAAALGQRDLPRPRLRLRAVRHGAIVRRARLGGAGDVRADAGVTSRMLLVVVGNVSREAVERAAGATLATLPRGEYVWSLPQDSAPPPVPVVMRERPVATNYVLGVFEGPPASAKDYAAFRVATALLSSRVGDMVRDQRRLSYAAYAPFTDRGISAGGVYFSTASPAHVLPLVKDQIKWVDHVPPDSIAMPYFTAGFIF